MHHCPAHTGGMICAPNAARVETNDVPQARGGDPAICVAALDFIVTGAKTVTVGSKPAARATDKTMHGGLVTEGSGNVMIGGPTAGVTLGGVDAGKKACAAAATGRHPEAGVIYPSTHPRAGQQIPGGTTKQSYNNCGIETSRILIQQTTGKQIDEDALMGEAIQKKQAGGSMAPDKRYGSGVTNGSERERILREHGVDASHENMPFEGITQAVAEGKGIITYHDAGKLWKNPRFANAGHVVLVTGMTYDENGKLVTVTVLDTGTGNCAAEIPVDQFKDSLGPGPQHPVVVTKGHAW
jgi:uncharacterized Zn-binding protein involved in type VI secretion